MEKPVLPSEWHDEIQEIEARLSAHDSRRRRWRRLMVLNLGLFAGFIFGTIHFFRFPVSVLLNLGVAVLWYLSERDMVKETEEERESLLARLDQLRPVTEPEGEESQRGVYLEGGKTGC